MSVPAVHSCWSPTEEQDLSGARWRWTFWQGKTYYQFGISQCCTVHPHSNILHQEQIGVGDSVKDLFIHALNTCRLQRVLYTVYIVCHDQLLAGMLSMNVIVKSMSPLRSVYILTCIPVMLFWNVVEIRIGPYLVFQTPQYSESMIETVACKHCVPSALSTSPQLVKQSDNRFSGTGRVKDTPTWTKPESWIQEYKYDVDIVS